MSPLLRKANRDGRRIVDITPESAGWRFVGFRALRLADGERESWSTGERELCLVVLSGRVDVAVGDAAFTDLGTRDSVFDPVSPAALYVPPGRAVTVTARGGRAEVALATAPSSGRHPLRLIDPSAMARSTRGQGSNTRHVCDILPHTDPCADHLLVVEVLTPAGHSSSYPPHKHDRDEYEPDGHDRDDAPLETQLEETYYHRVDPPQGFAFQRVYTDDRRLDEAMAVEDHDTVLVPCGYHPVVAPHGYRLYYLNVMAGPTRNWVFRNDPAHEWMLAPR